MPASPTHLEFYLNVVLVLLASIPLAQLCQPVPLAQQVCMPVPLEDLAVSNASLARIPLEWEPPCARTARPAHGPWRALPPATTTRTRSSRWSLNLLAILCAKLILAVVLLQQSQLV